MSSTDKSRVSLNGNGQPVSIPHTPKHTLWTPPASGTATPEPLWHLRVCVLKDAEGMGDCPNRRFDFKSRHHLTHASNQLEEAFGNKFEFKKCGLEMGDAMGGRVNDGRTENITIEYNSDIGGNGGWKAFLAKLKQLEDEWDHEGVSLL